MNKPGLVAAGNWKMNGLRADLVQIESIKVGIEASAAPEVWIFPPATLIQAAAAIVAGSPIRIGAQDCYTKTSGAFTGDLSAAMLKDAGASVVIVGHSERRILHCEPSRLVREKAAAAIRCGLNVIICVGETEGEREARLALAVCERQLHESLPDESTPENTVIAYEPVWAIGSGLVPTQTDIAAVHAPLRARLNERGELDASHAWRILYGGSVTPSNAEAIFSCDEVDGALVGGASLNAASFLAIIAAAAQAQEKRRP